MEFNFDERGKNALLQSEYWTIGKWFSFLVILMAVWAGVYLAAHSAYGIPGSEYATFSTQQVRQINRILTTDNAMMSSAANANTAPVTMIDSSVSLIDNVNETSQYNTTGCDIPCRIDKVLVYINSEFDGRITPEQLQALKLYIGTFGQQDVGIFLADYKLKVRSYFWLAGPLIYAEVVFWVVIGVICSLLFAVGNILRNRNKRSFDNKQIMYQVAKLFYAPFTTIVILLAYNYFNKNTTISSNLGQGIIIFAFIAGFYSGRVMGFFDKLKNVLFGGASQSGNEYNNAQQQVVYTTQQPQAEAIAQPYVANTAEVQETLAVNENGELNAAILQKRQDGELIDVDVEVKLDIAGLFDEEKDDILKRGFSKAIVTLHNVNGKDIIPAKKTVDKDGPIFTAHDVRPGIYIARATLSQKLQDDHIINLFGERTSYITVDKPGLELYIRKYELVD